MKRVCEFCGKAFQAQRATRKTCSEPCRAKLNTRKRRMAAAGEAVEPVAPVFSVPGPSQSRSGSLADVTERALSQAGKLDTPLGLLAMVIAIRMGEFSPLDNAAGLVALSRELDRLLATVLVGSEPPDELDELERRRRLKAARAR